MKAIFVIPLSHTKDKAEFLWQLKDIEKCHREHMKHANNGFPFNHNQSFSFKYFVHRFVITIDGERCALKDLIIPRLQKLFEEYGFPETEEYEPVVYETQVEEMHWHENMCEYVARVKLSDTEVHQGALEALGVCLFREHGEGEERYVHGEAFARSMPYWKIEAAKLIWDKMSDEQKKAQRELVDFYRLV